MHEDIAHRFLALVRPVPSEAWRNKSPWGNDAEQILLELVKAAGYSCHHVAIGEVRGDYIDQCGPTGETYLINGTCPYVVFLSEQQKHSRATEWLNGLVSCVSRYVRDDNVEEVYILKRIEEIIESVIPLAPVLLTQEGEALAEHRHLRDHDALDSTAGMHRICGGWVDRKKVSDTHDALVCRSCHLRVTFPNTIRTYGELRQEFAKRLK